MKGFIKVCCGLRLQRKFVKCPQFVKLIESLLKNKLIKKSAEQAMWIPKKQPLLVELKKQKSMLKTRARTSRTRKKIINFFVNIARFMGIILKGVGKYMGILPIKKNTWVKDNATTSEANTTLNENPNQEPNIVEARFTK